MELYERVKEIPGLFGISQAELARTIEMSPQTFAGWLKRDRQDNIWPVLPKMLETYPTLSREWLYFGEGEPFAHKETASCLQVKMQTLEAELEKERAERRALEEELRDASRVNRALAMRLVDETLRTK